MSRSAWQWSLMVSATLAAGVLWLGFAASGGPRGASAAPPPPSDARPAPPSAVAGAAGRAGEQAAQGSAGQYVALRRLPRGVTLATLANGLTVIVQENHTAPVATVRCYVRNTGSAYEGRHLGAGLSHVLEHVVAGGSTSHRSEKEIERLIDSFGGATNAYTSTDLTSYLIDCPADRVPLAVELMAEAMLYCKFEPAEFDREIKVIRRELADGEVNRQRVLWKLLHQTLYTQHPVRHPVIGYLDVLDRTTREAIIEFYRERYVPNNQVVVVVGDVETDKVLAEVARHWAAAPRGPDLAPALPDEPEQLSPRLAVREMDGSTYDMVFAWPTVKLSHPDLYALDLAAYILAEGESARLARRLKHDEPLALSVSSASYTPHFVSGFFAVLATSPPQAWQRTAEIILQEVKRLGEELVGPEELARAKKQKAAELVFELQTVQDAAESLGRSFIATGDPLFDEFYVERIQQVTAEEVRDVARCYLRPERLNRVLITPPGAAPQTVQMPAAPEETPVRKLSLPNGLRVLVKRQAHLPLVNMQAYVLAGCLADDEQTAGRSALVAAMLDKGTSEHTARQIAEFFDSRGGRLEMGAGRFTVFGSASVLRDDFSQALAMFAECFTQPTFPEEEFENVRRLALAQIARRADSPEGEAFELFYDSLPEGSPYRLLQEGKAETVGRLRSEDLRAYHRQYFVPQNMVVTVFGDLDPDQAASLVREHFGSLPPAADFQPPAFDRPNQIANNIIRHKQTRKPTGMVILGYPGTSIRQPQDHAAMTVLDALVSGYSFPGGWLHNELRGAGLVYYVHAFQIAGPAPGYFAVVAQTWPEKTGEVADRIQRKLQQARAGQIAEDEFETAKQMVIALHAQENTTLAEQARQAALDELYGLGFDYDREFAARISAVTREHVVRVAREYLNHYVLVTTSPLPEPAQEKPY